MLMLKALMRIPTPDVSRRAPCRAWFQIAVTHTGKLRQGQGKCLGFNYLPRGDRSPPVAASQRRAGTIGNEKFTNPIEV
jgi:hypothetical protein